MGKCVYHRQKRLHRHFKPTSVEKSVTFPVTMGKRNEGESGRRRMKRNYKGEEGSRKRKGNSYCEF